MSVTYSTSVDDRAQDRHNCCVECVYYPAEDVVQEVLERQKWSKNVIIFKVPEQPKTMSGAEHPASELRTISEILHITDKDTYVSNLHVQRLGKFYKTRSRPIKILSSESEVLNVIRGAKNVANNTPYNNIRLYFDRTPKQREYYKLMRSQLIERTNKGETNFKIKYFNCVPHIVRNLK